ncbi:TlyA family RNA methyltransferase [Eubacteriales bacterium mix99]
MRSPRKERIDVLMVQKGLSDNREKAKRILMSGLVFVNQQRVDKPGTLVPVMGNIEVRAKNPFVSRGGRKLEKALDRFPVSVCGRNWLDIGASTGGFTDCLLKHGAAKVYSIDVGYGQLAWRLRQDSRVVVMERTNIRNVKKEDLNSPVNGAAIDVSFISLKLVLPVVSRLLTEDSPVLSLIKPQFEVERDEVGEKGVVREAGLHRRVVEEILEFAQDMGWKIQDLDFSPITGPKGNIEFLAYFRKGGGDGLRLEDREILVNKTVQTAHDTFDKRVTK